MNTKKARRIGKNSRRTKYRQNGGTIRDKALKVFKDNNIELRSFVIDLYKSEKTKTIDGIVFKVVKKADRYFDIFNLYLYAKPEGPFSLYYEEIKEVDVGSSSLT